MIHGNGRYWGRAINHQNIRRPRSLEGVQRPKNADCDHSAHVSKGGAISAAGSTYQGITICYGQSSRGLGRFHYAENIQFARQARGSLYEIIDHLTVAQEEKLISDETFTLVREGVLRAVLVVNGFIRYLPKARTSSRHSRLTINEGYGTISRI